MKLVLIFFMFRRGMLAGEELFTHGALQHFCYVAHAALTGAIRAGFRMQVKVEPRVSFGKSYDRAILPCTSGFQPQRSCLGGKPGEQQWRLTVCLLVKTPSLNVDVLQYHQAQWGLTLFGSSSLNMAFISVMLAGIGHSSIVFKKSIACSSTGSNDAGKQHFHGNAMHYSELWI